VTARGKVESRCCNCRQSYVKRSDGVLEDGERQDDGEPEGISTGKKGKEGGLEVDDTEKDKLF
jgi:hypothetical protein